MLRAMRDASALKRLGAALLLVTLALGWAELSPPVAVLVLGLAMLAIAVAIGCEVREVPELGPAALVLATSGCAAGYVLTMAPLHLVGLGLSFATLGALAWRHRQPAATRHRTLTFQGLAWAGLALSMGLSHQFFYVAQLGDLAFVERRVWMTVAWLLAGLGLFVRGSGGVDAAARGGGVVLLAAGLVKLLAYDTLMLGGVLRIAVFGLSAVSLLGAASVLERRDEAQRQPSTCARRSASRAASS